MIRPYGSIWCGFCKKEVDKNSSHMSNHLSGLFWHIDCYDKKNRLSYRAKDKVCDHEYDSYCPQCGIDSLEEYVEQ